MRRRALALAAVVPLALLSACNSDDAKPAASSSSHTSTSSSSSSSTSSAVPTTTAAPATTSAASPSKSVRGLVPKQLNETAGISSIDGQRLIVTLAVTEFEVDPSGCEAYTSPLPAGMHRIVVHMTITTDPTLATDPNMQTFDPSPWDFNIVGPDGITENKNIADGLCYPISEQLGPDIGPAQTVTGVIELQSKNTTGILMFRPAATKPGGWEWAF